MLETPNCRRTKGILSGGRAEPFWSTVLLTLRLLLVAVTLLLLLLLLLLRRIPVPSVLRLVVLALAVLVVLVGHIDCDFSSGVLIVCGLWTVLRV